MAFTWTTLDGAVAAAHHQEIKTNINAVSSALSIADYAWTYSPGSGDIVAGAHINELRDAADYLDDNNVCSAYNSGDDGTVYSGRNSSYDSGDDVSANSSADSDVCSSHYVSDLGTHDDLHNSTYNSSYDGSLLTAYFSSDEGGLESTYNSGDLGTDYGSDDAVVDGADGP